MSDDHGATRSRFAGWNIPPLLRGAALGGELPQDFRLGELAVGRLHWVDDDCEVYLVTHTGDGASYTAGSRGARRSRSSRSSRRRCWTARGGSAVTRARTSRR